MSLFPIQPASPSLAAGPLPAPPAFPALPAVWCHEDPVRGHHRALSIRRRDVVLADVFAGPSRARAMMSSTSRTPESVSTTRSRIHGRPTRRYGTRYIQNALEPYGLGDRWAFVNYDGSYHGRRAEDVQRFCCRRRTVHQSVRRLLVLARRVRSNSSQGRSSTPTRSSRSWPLPRPNRGMSSSSEVSIGSSRSARTSARRRRRFPLARLPGTRHGSP